MTNPNKTPIKRLTTCVRCGQKYETYMSVSACDNICNDPKCAEKYYYIKMKSEELFKNG